MIKSLLKRWIFGGEVDCGLRNASDRDAWIRAQLKALPAGGRILDAGAGEQPYRADCAHLKYVAQDFAQYTGTGDGSGLQQGTWDQKGLDLVCDITAIPEPDASFDAVLLTEVVEHLFQPELALRELARLLKPGGRIIITAPFNSLTHFAPYHFSTGFNRYYHEKMLPLCGFKALEIKPSGSYFELMAQELRRLPEVAQQYAGAKAGLWERFLVHRLIRAVARHAARDSGSHQLQAYEYFVLAERLPGGAPQA